MRNNRRIGPLLAWATAAVIGLGIAGAASAWASPAAAVPAGTGADTGTMAASQPPSGRHPARGGLLAKRLGGRLGAVQHGELVVRTRDGFKTVEVQRGTVTAATATSLTVRSADGYTAAYPISATTRVRVNGHQADATSLRKGQTVGVLAEKQAGGLSTLFVRAFDPGRAPAHGRGMRPRSGGGGSAGSGRPSPSPTSLVRPGSLSGAGAAVLT